MKRASWLLMIIFVFPLLLAGAGAAEAAQGKNQNFGSTKRDCKPPMSSADYPRCGFGGGGRR